MGSDASHGYDDIAEAFIAARSDANRDVVAAWAADLPPQASVIDIGAGAGEPVTRTLLSAGLSVRAIDAAPNMVATFRARFPHVPILCEDALSSDYFGQRFQAAIAIGLIFLLSPDAQRQLLDRIAAVLVPGGRLLFTAPHQIATWDDILTGRKSTSLGRQAYRAHLERAGFVMISERQDAHNNRYFDATLGPGAPKS